MCATEARGRCRRLKTVFSLSSVEWDGGFALVSSALPRTQADPMHGRGNWAAGDAHDESRLD